MHSAPPVETALRPIPFKPSRLIGLSEDLLARHYEVDYGAALRRLNAIAHRLAMLDWGEASVQEILDLKRAEASAANGVVLHEVYFDSLGGQDGLGSPTAPPRGPLADAIRRDFGSLTAWREAFTAIARSLSDGEGWVLLGWCRRQQRLVIQVAEGHGGLQAETVPILALDLCEHAYQRDFGDDLDAYIAAFLDNLHWGRPASRFSQAVAAGENTPAPAEWRLAPEDLRDQLMVGDAPFILDLCLADDRPKRHDKVIGAEFCLAEQSKDIMQDLPKDRLIVVYCLYGYQVSGDAVAELRQEGFDARQLAGGIAAWHALAGPTEPLV